MNMVVRQFPPRESCRMRVILLSRYGTCDFCRRGDGIKMEGMVMREKKDRARDKIRKENDWRKGGRNKYR